MGAEQLWQASGSRGGDGQLNMHNTHPSIQADHKRKIGSNEKRLDLLSCLIGLLKIAN